jgi:antirestriction protein ArdC
MSPSNRQPARGERGTLYQEVTDKIVSELEQGRFPWVQPWGGASAALGLPKNAATTRRYSGINVLVLWGAVIDKGYRGQNWLTFRQALALGGSVRKGEKGTTVFYADKFIPKGEQERAAKDGDDPSAVPFLKRFTVFNVEQCDGLPETAFAGMAPLPAREVIPHAEDLIKRTGADFRVGGARAFYQ